MAKKIEKKKIVKKTGVVIQDCIFHGVEWDGKALESVDKVAEAMLITSKGLLTMAQLFRYQGVECCINIVDNKTSKKK